MLIIYCNFRVGDKGVFVFNRRVSGCLYLLEWTTGLSTVCAKAYFEGIIDCLPQCFANKIALNGSFSSLC